MHRSSIVMLAGTVIAIALVVLGATRGPANANAHAHARDVPVMHVQP